MVYDNLQAVKALIDCVRGPEMSMTLIFQLLILDTCLWRYQTNFPIHISGLHNSQGTNCQRFNFQAPYSGIGLWRGGRELRWVSWKKIWNAMSPCTTRQSTIFVWLFCLVSELQGSISLFSYCHFPVLHLLSHPSIHASIGPSIHQLLCLFWVFSFDRYCCVFVSQV